MVHSDGREVERAVTIPEDTLSFTFVRHPLWWYQSMWAHRMDERWRPIAAPAWFSLKWRDFWNEFSVRCRAEDFDLFLKKCVEEYPKGLASSVYEEYTAGCGFVGKQENLPEDLLTALKLAGEAHDAERILQVERKNVRGSAPRQRRKMNAREETVEKVCCVEHRAMDRYGYMTVPAQARPHALSVWRSQIAYVAQVWRERFAMRK